MLVGNKAKFLLHIFYCSLADIDVLSEVLYMHFNTMDFSFRLQMNQVSRSLLVLFLRSTKLSPLNQMCVFHLKE